MNLTHKLRKDSLAKKVRIPPSKLSRRTNITMTAEAQCDQSPLIYEHDVIKYFAQLRTDSSQKLKLGRLRNNQL